MAIKSKIERIGRILPEAPEKPGLTGIASHGAWQDATNPSYGAETMSGPLYVKSDGIIDVYPATAFVPGVVLLTDNVTQIPQGQNYTAVPTAAAIRKYVTDVVGKQEIEIDVPVATTADLGGIIVGENFNITSAGLLTIKAANETTRGGVMLAPSIEEEELGVPTASMVKSYVDGQLEEIRNRLAYLEGS
jgi:hypothetical protein